MKNTKTLKIALFIISAALLLGAAVGITASAAEGTSAPEVYSQNVEYGGNYALMYAITAESVTGDTVSLAVYDNAECAGNPVWSKTVAATEANQETVKGKACYVFTTNGIAAKNMDVQYYVKVTAANGETVKRYSVAEYLYERLYKNGIASSTEEGDIKRAELYNTILLYGKQAQDVLCNYNTDENGELITSDDRTTFVTDMKYVFVADDAGTINGSYAPSIILKGNEATFVANDTSVDWYLINPETEALIGSIASGDSFTVNSHVRVDNSFEIRGSGKYAESAVNYTDATLDSLTSEGITNLNIATGHSITVEDGALHYTATAATGKNATLSFENKTDTTATALVFETDIMFTNAVFTDMRFVGSSNVASTPAKWDLQHLIAPNADGGYDVKLKKDGSYVVAATIPEGEWVNYRYEFDGTKAGSAVRFYINHTLVMETTLAGGVVGTIGISFFDSGKSFSSGTVSFDNTYFGPQK
ncbi:MAG: hypothetical protein J6B48_10090 [Clostridia bacterium]|nr:hypothetical protein [Clostridia bacterium]